MRAEHLPAQSITQFDPSAGPVASGPRRVLLIRGASGAGKSVLAGMLAAALPDWLRWSIDDQRKTGGDWPQMLSLVANLERNAILESVVLSKRYKAVLARHDVACVTVVCREDVRLQRLYARDGHLPSPRDYAGWPQVPNMRVDSTAGIDADSVASVLDWLDARARSEPDRSSRAW